MFNVDDNGNITLTAGDTGSASFVFTREDSVAWATGDVAVFTVNGLDGSVLLQNVYDLAANAGAVNILFANATTDEWTAGSYQYDIRCVVSPLYESGNAVPVDGDIVSTADIFPKTITITRPVGQI